MWQEFSKSTFSLQEKSIEENKYVELPYMAYYVINDCGKKYDKILRLHK